MLSSFHRYPHSIHSEKSNLRQNKGQIVVEYILLLMVAVSLATLIVNQMVKRDADNPGVVVKAWSDLIIFISQDKSDSFDAP